MLRRFAEQAALVFIFAAAVSEIAAHSVAGCRHLRSAEDLPPQSGQKICRMTRLSLSVRP